MDPSGSVVNGAPPKVDELVMERAVEVHLDRLTIGDLEVLERFSQRDTSASELIDFLERIVDGDVRKMPLTDLGQIVDAVQSAVVDIKSAGN